MHHFYINGDLESATGVLDDIMVPYDFDSGNRIMISDDYVEEATEAWDEAGIDYDLI